MWRARPLSTSTRAFITFPRILSDLLMLHPSLSRSPTAFVYFMRSLPAKSTKWNRLYFIWVTPSDAVFDWRVIEKTVCERDDSLFIEVAPLWRFRPPVFKMSAAWRKFYVSISVKLSTNTPWKRKLKKVILVVVVIIK